MTKSARRVDARRAFFWSIVNDAEEPSVGLPSLDDILGLIAEEMSEIGKWLSRREPLTRSL